MKDRDASPTRTPIAVSVSVANEQTILAIDGKQLRRAVRLVLRDAGIRAARISVAVVDDATIARLNWQYLRHRGPTDVLSFALDATSDELEGEVIVGAETAIREAPKYRWAPHDELLLYVIHGMLHIVGHDDTTAVTRHEMQEHETQILAKLGIVRR